MSMQEEKTKAKRLRVVGNKMLRLAAKIREAETIKDRTERNNAYSLAQNEYLEARKEWANLKGWI